jgi:hypothetical protein
MIGLNNCHFSPLNFAATPDHDARPSPTVFLS